MERLKEKYLKDIQPKLMKDNKYSSVMEVPKIIKVSVNIGVGEAIQNQKSLDAAVNDLTLVTGRKPSIAKAKKAISNFKLRQGVAIGCFVTLRRSAMYEFLDRLISVAIPRIRD
ncbi:MAG: 50S ribosomal protein L5, partial [Candidatus Zixiibacteriota bacterium]